MIQLLVMAKAPVPGRVKTRLCPPCTPEQAAAIAAAALEDTLKTAKKLSFVRHTLVIEGAHPAPSGWALVPQRGDGLGERLANAFADTALPGVPSLLIGMDTPQVTVALLRDAAEALCRAGSVLGPADDGGWWALGLSDPADAAVLPDVPMSAADTGERTLRALRARGVRPAPLPGLRDVDTAADALAVAAACEPGHRFPAIVADTIGRSIPDRSDSAPGAKTSAAKTTTTTASAAKIATARASGAKTTAAGANLAKTTAVEAAGAKTTTARADAAETTATATGVGAAKTTATGVGAAKTTAAGTRAAETTAAGVGAAKTIAVGAGAATTIVAGSRS
ncbi:hypothetical protein L3i22_064000 [Actinoplanes sp. L3-i22]|nr:TIGR04282 family arsenosugar biosynthesis glycosyltransferase [Actinoplanes sp. L3-i22]BCY11312.1 hypothetical protein L3i22_064000 [Actinoplanes sp. L3-i22]